MAKILGLVILALGSGLLVSWLALDNRPANSALSRISPAPVAPAGAGDPVHAMLESLAAIVDAEVLERRRLEQKLEALAAELQAVRRTSGGEQSAVEASQAEFIDAPPGTSESMTLSALVAAGIDEIQARRIKAGMDALDLEMMNLQYAAEQEGWTGTQRFADAVRANQEQRESLRESIGDESYDRFLYAMGQPNRIAVQDVLDGSPAERAGLQPGDMLLSYAGRRLFTVGELIEQSRGGSPNQTVVLDVVRDGRRMQIYLPRGPLGIRGGFHRADPDETSS
ncbi:MAG: PDZ domain-containing protein [Gammaproteobacteria bacterium]|nr:PDZ domain-containing protein [Gammaproteobacteria bacterium]